MNRRKFLIGATAAACAASLAVRPMAGQFQPNPVLAAGMQLGNLAKSAYFTSEGPTPRELVTT
jgi:hypothetical protein